VLCKVKFLFFVVLFERARVTSREASPRSLLRGNIASMAKSTDFHWFFLRIILLHSTANHLSRILTFLCHVSTVLLRTPTRSPKNYHLIRGFPPEETLKVADRKKVSLWREKEKKINSRDAKHTRCIRYEVRRKTSYKHFHYSISIHAFASTKQKKYEIE
jgi:hypothetical protein